MPQYLVTYRNGKTIRVNADSTADAKRYVVEMQKRRLADPTWGGGRGKVQYPVSAKEI